MTSRGFNVTAFVIGLVGLAAGLVPILLWAPFIDTASFWLPWSRPIYDPSLPLSVPHFVQSPVLALFLRPFGLLPFPVFAVGWTCLAGVAYWWLLRPLPPAPRVITFAAACTFALNGNIEWALAVAAVIGVRRPSAWLVAAFTKVAPFLGFGWFVLRRQWRAVAVTAGVGLALVAASAVLLPGAWPAWIGMLRAFGSEPTFGGPFVPNVPLLPRLVVAVALLALGTARRQPAVLALVLLLAQPDLQPWALGYLAAAPRLLTPASGAATSIGAEGDGCRDATTPGGVTHLRHRH